MSLHQYSDLFEAIAHGVMHKAGWTATGIISVSTSVSLSYYQKVWFTVGEVGVTGVEIAWTLATILVPLSIINVALGVYEHILEINLRRRTVKWDGICRRSERRDNAGS